MSMKRAALCAVAALALCAPVGAQETPDLTGVWSGILTTDTDPYWKIQDLACFPGCQTVLRERMIAIMAAGPPSPNQQAEDAQFALDHLMGISTPEGLARLQASQIEPALETYCEPYGLLREAMNPLPVRIREEGGDLVFEYEEWSLTRTIHMEPDAPAPAEPSALGHSTGRWEGETLVVESTALTGDYYPYRAGAYADGATIVERYVVEEDPRRLILELTITDPVTLTEPYVWHKTWLYTPDVELFLDSCEDVPGEF